MPADSHCGDQEATVGRAWTPLYEFSDDLGPDDLNDIVPIPGGVPIRHAPQTVRLGDLIAEPGGFEQWAREVLGVHDAITERRDVLDRLEALRVEFVQLDHFRRGSLMEARRIVHDVINVLDREAAARYLGVSERELLRYVSSRNTRTAEARTQVRDLHSQGLSVRRIALATGIPRSSVQDIVKAA